MKFLVKTKLSVEQPDKVEVIDGIIYDIYTKKIFADNPKKNKVPDGLYSTVKDKKTTRTQWYELTETKP